LIKALENRSEHRPGCHFYNVPAESETSLQLDAAPSGIRRCNFAEALATSDQRGSAAAVGRTDYCATDFASPAVRESGGCFEAAGMGVSRGANAGKSPSSLTDERRH